MKHIKKALAMLLSATLVLTSVSIDTFAAGTEDEAMESTEVIENNTAESSSEDALTNGDINNDSASEETINDSSEDVNDVSEKESDLQAQEDPVKLAAVYGSKPADGTTTNQPFSTLTSISQYFRIPAMVTLEDGTIVTAADARWNGTGDGGGNDTVVSYSEDNGSTWHYTFANYIGDNGNYHNEGSTCFIDPALATDGTTVYMMVDLYPNGIGLNSAASKPSIGDGFDSKGNLRLSADNKSTYEYYLNLTDYNIYNNSGTATDYSTDKYFNLYQYGAATGGNLFDANSPYQVFPTNYLYLTSSSNGGATWSTPTLVNVKKSTEQTCLVGPGTGIVTSTGRIIFTVYNYTNGDKNTSVIYSDDYGKTWTRSADMNATSSEATLTEVKVGSTNTLYMFTRHGGYYTSTDNGATWSNQMNVGITYNTGTQLNVMTYSKTIDGYPAILLSAPGSGSDSSNRTNGKIFVGLIQSDGSITWKYTYSVNNGTFQYSSITELSDGKIGLLYENGAASITYASYDIADVAKGATIGTDTTVTYTAAVDKTTLTVGDTANLSVTASDSSTASATWTSSDSSVLSVYGTTATANKEGTATLTATLPDATTQSFTITVNAASSSDTDADVKKEEIAGSTVYQLDTDGVDSGSEYVIYSAVGGKNLYNVSGSSTTDQVTGTVSDSNYNSDTTFTLDSNFAESTQLWTVTASGSGYTLKGNNSGTYLNLASTTTSKANMNSDATAAGSVLKITKSETGNTVSYSYRQTNYLVHSSTSSNQFYTSTSTTGNVLYFFKKTTTSAGTKYTADNSKLTALITTASAFTESDYTAASWSAFQTALTAAKAIAAPTSYDSESEAQTEQTAINAAAKKLNDAINALVKVKNVTVLVGKSVTYENITGTLNTSSLDTSIATASLENGILTINGVKVGGPTNIQVGNVIYNITVTDAEVITDTISIEQYASTHLNVTLEDGQTITWKSDDPSTAYVYSTVAGTATVLGQKVGTTTISGTVKDSSGNTVKIYKYDTTVTTGTAPNTGKYTVTYSFTESVTNGTLYYSIDGGELVKVEKNSEGTYDDISLTVSNVAYSGIVFFVAPDKGYATTVVTESGSKAQYYTLDADSLSINYPSTHSGGKVENFTTDAQEKAMISQAVSYGCDAVLWNSRGGESSTLSKNESVEFRIVVVCDKLPTVSKSITSVTHEGSTTSYNDGSSIELGDTINYTLTVNYYDVTDISSTDDNDIAYTNIVLKDQLTGYTKSIEDKTIYNASDDKYTTSLTVTMDNYADVVKDGEIVNTVDLSYTYQSAYSKGTSSSSDSAEASIEIKMPSYVIDFGSPINVDLSSVLGSETITKGEAAYGKVTVNGTTLTYTPDKVLQDVDHVVLTLTNNKSYGITVYPATTVYYDEGFATASGFTGGTISSTAQQTQIGGDSSKTYNVFGYDDAYASTYPGTAATSSTKGSTEIFTFTGTGFDLYVNSTSTTGKIAVQVRDSNNKLYKVATVNTVSTDTMYESISNTDEYGLTAVSYTNFDYGTYTVKITVTSSDVPVNFDGFKVYNTLKTEPDCYKTAMEDNPTFIELRDHVIATINEDVDVSGEEGEDESEKTNEQVYDEDAVNDNTDMGDAVIYTDDPETSIITDRDSYIENGPKNEVFLLPDESIIFKIDTNKTVQVGMKAVKGTTSYEGTISGTISSNVDMFYKVLSPSTSDSEQTVVIKNTGSNVLSLSKIKVCDDPDAALETVTAADIEAALAQPSEPEVTYADALCAVNLVDYTGNVIVSSDLTANGVVGELGTFTADDIKAAAESVLPSDYAFVDESTVTDTSVAYGESGSVDIQIGKVATLKITYKKGFKTVGTATLTHIQTSEGSKYTFSTSEIKAAAPSGLRVISLWGTSVNYGSTKSITATGR